MPSPQDLMSLVDTLNTQSVTSIQSMLLMNGSNTLAALSITAVLIFFFIMFIYHEFGVATNIINIARAGAITGLFLSALMIAAVYYAILPPIADYIAYGLFGGSLIFLIFSFLVSSIR